MFDNNRRTIIVTAFALLVITIMAYFISLVPYIAAESGCNNQDRFLGQVAYMDDQNMYFSFIRQAYLGKWSFNNKLTHIKNRDCFFNLQFLIIGKLWKIYKLSENSAYQLWRYIGIVSIVLGYFLVVQFFFQSRQQRFGSTVLFIFAGGLGFLFTVLNLDGIISKELFHKLTLDLWGAVFPFQQILTNPHFALPHGILLIGIAAYLFAYTKDNKSKYYVVSGLVFAIDGVIRPYDLISLFTIIPLFVLVENIIRFELKSAFKQCIPLVVAMPSMIYSIWLFKFDPVFKYWSLQGYNIGLLPLPHMHLLAYGVFTILFLLRLFTIKANPLTGSERFILVCFSAIFILTHIGHIIPSLGFSPQIGVPLFSFISILAFSYVFSCTQKQKKIIIPIIVLAVVWGGVWNNILFYTKIYQ